MLDRDKAINNNVESDRDYEKRFFLLVSLVFFVIVAITTYIHYNFPSVFGTPSVPLPRKMPEAPLFLENLSGFAFNAFISSFAIYHSIKKYGYLKTAMFLYGAMIFAGLEENEWIIVEGRWLGKDTYFFTVSLLWFFEIPVNATLGWYFIAYSTYEISNLLLQGRSIYARAFFAGFIGMVLDLLADPVYVNFGYTCNPPSPYGLWVWEDENVFRLFSIPFSNFVGWFLVISVFIIYFEHFSKKLDSNPEKIREISLSFFVGIIGILFLTYFILHIVSFILRPFSHVNLVPIEFPLQGGV